MHHVLYRATTAPARSLEIIPATTHLFEEPDTLGWAAQSARNCFQRYLPEPSGWRQQNMTLAPQIAFRNMETAEELEEVVLKEAKKLELFFPRIVSCRVAIEAPRTRRESHRIRIDLGVPGEELVVEHNAEHNAEHGAKRYPEKPAANRVRREAEIAIRVAFRELRGRVQEYAQRIRPVIEDREGPLEGKVTKLLPDYGFIEADDHGVYFHRNSVVGGHFDQLRIGSRVRFAEEDGEKGPQASTVKMVRPARQRREAASTDVLRRSA
jgi:cold shock CspA family protein